MILQIVDSNNRPHGGVRILVVDDFSPWRTKVKSILQARPEWKVIGEATDGIEAVQEAYELHPDVVLLDIEMPRLNRIEAGKQIRKASPASRIIFLSQINDKEIIEEAQKISRAGYVLKINALTDLIPVIAAALIRIPVHNDNGSELGRPKDLIGG